MDAPLYPPAKAYEPPRRLPRVLSTRDTPVAILKSVPAAWAIVVKEIPSIDRRTGGEQIKPHLGNFSLESLLVFGVVQRDAIERIDAQLKALGEFK
ncbi:hypothetical protein GCM10011494_00140 [Novosphingobium endophyticum]|uniref:Uncharacterized protein n=1 Tax=Novosphingobium endophyticum TaxID=1955250 RepID=A0A916TQ15_9SPHN|nr:hypothetical protein [Novosphingobium endophyticum]GGB85847.1 hypothetical protein GCM10011494_00140 [Novosphingobium endophyticum]